jgi:O-antigen ligase
LASSVQRKATAHDLAAHASTEKRERAARLLEAFVFYALLSLVALASIPYGSNEDWWEALVACAVYALTVLWIVEGMIRGRWHVPEQRRLFYPLIGLVCFAFLQSLPLWRTTLSPLGEGAQTWRAISADPFETRLFVFRLLALILVCALLLGYTTTERRMRAIVYTVMCVATLSALFGILRQATEGHASLAVLPRLKPWEGYAQFVNRNHFAFLMEMALGLVLGLLAGGGVRREQLLIFLATVLPLWTALSLSASRGGILSALAQLLMIALLWSVIRPARVIKDAETGWLMSLRRIVSLRLVRLLLILFLCAGVLVSVVWIGGEPTVTRFETVAGDFKAEGRYGASRQDIWRATWELIKSQPLVGTGLNGYWVAITRFHNASGFYTPQQAHNDYLEILAGGGIIGAALAAWFLFELFRRIRSRLRAEGESRFNRAAAFGATVGLFGVAVHSIFDFGLHIMANALVCTLLIVIATTQVRSAEQVESKRKVATASRR